MHPVIKIMLPLLMFFMSCSTVQKNHITGRYAGELPCASCSAIDYEIEFRTDSMYLEQIIYRDHEASVFIRYGLYNIDNGGMIILDKAPDTGMNLFNRKNRHLRMLDIAGNTIEGELAENYILKKEQDHDKETERYLKAHGVEPFWSLTLFPGRHVTFSIIDGRGEDIELPIPQIPFPEKGKDRSYRIEYPGGILTIWLTTEICSDTMSDILYPMKIRLHIENENGYNMYEGCAFIQAQGEERLYYER
jgi:uncharacterized membrane protein